MIDRLLKVAGFSLAILLVACNRNTQNASEGATAPTASAPAAVPAAPSQPAAPAIPPSTETGVNTVESVMITRSQDAPDQVFVSASGTVLSPGWTNARLVPMESANGDTTIRSFTFVATSPAAPSPGTAVQPIEAQLQIDSLPPEVKAIRIVSATNEVSATVGSP